MDENLVYVFVAPKATVDLTKVFVWPALCAGSQLKRIQTGQAWSGHAVPETWKPGFHKCCFNIHFTSWHVWQLPSFHSSFRATYSLFTQVVLLRLCQKMSAPSVPLTSVSPARFSLVQYKQTRLWTPSGKLPPAPSPMAREVAELPCHALCACPPAPWGSLHSSGTTVLQAIPSPDPLQSWAGGSLVQCNHSWFLNRFPGCAQQHILLLVPSFLGIKSACQMSPLPTYSGLLACQSLISPLTRWHWKSKAHLNPQAICVCHMQIH